MNSLKNESKKVVAMAGTCAVSSRYDMCYDFCYCIRRGKLKYNLNDLSVSYLMGRPEAILSSIELHHHGDDHHHTIIYLIS